LSWVYPAGYKPDVHTGNRREGNVKTEGGLAQMTKREVKLRLQQPYLKPKKKKKKKENEKRFAV